MTMIPMYKTCPRCKRKYSWNLDVGKMWCPNCGSLGMLGTGDIPWRKKGCNSRKKKISSQTLVIFVIISLGFLALVYYQ